MMLTIDRIQSLKVLDLQKELKKLGQDSTGKKDVLRKRLEKHLAKEAEHSAVKDAVESKVAHLPSEQEQKQEKETTVAEATGNTVTKRTSPSEKPSTVAPASPLQSSPLKGEKSGPHLTKKAGSTGNNGEQQQEGEEQKESSCTLHITNFVRPFTLNAVKKLVQTHGEMVENGFWMDAIKSHCYVTYASETIATQMLEFLQGKVWPPESRRALTADYATQTALEVTTNGEAKATHPLSSKRKTRPSTMEADGPQEKKSRPSLTIDAFFRKTQATPMLYYLPVSSDEVTKRKERLAKGLPLVISAPPIPSSASTSKQQRRGSFQTASPRFPHPRQRPRRQPQPRA